jgi:hypothetical protein
MPKKKTMELKQAMEVAELNLQEETMAFKEAEKQYNALTNK